MTGRAAAPISHRSHPVHKTRGAERRLGPVVLGVCQRVLIKGRPERRRDNGALLLANAGQRVAHKV